MPTRYTAPLPVPHKDRVPVKVAKALVGAVKVAPRTPDEARRRFDRYVDRTLIVPDSRREALVRHWGGVASRLSRLPGGGRGTISATWNLSSRMLEHGHADAARSLLETVARAFPEADSSVGLRARVRVVDLNAGREVDDLGSLIAQSLRLADEAWEQGDIDDAAARLQDAFDVALHRVHHFEDRPSPYAEDPDAFLAPFRASVAFRAAATPSGSRRPAPPAHGSERPHRLLFATATNFNFARGIIDEYSEREDVEVRQVDIRALEDGPWRPNPADLTRNRLRQAAGTPMDLPPSVREDLDWADTIFVEWGHRAMVWMSMVPDLRARVVVRLHSYEALTQFPLITDWSGIDDVVFVAGHIRNLVERSVPAIMSGPRRHTIGNRRTLRDYALPKRPGAERALGLIGWGQVVKDPAWALDVLEDLRRDDPAWHLRLVGNPFPEDEKLTRAAAEYNARHESRIERLGDAVLRPGFTRDVPHALRRIGVILSTSQREGTHEALIQGAASGALPVVRNWPTVARWGGAQTMFPDAWIVETPQQAADRIRAAVAAGDLQAEGAKAREWVLTHHDWSVVGPQLERLLLDPKEGRTA